MDHEQMRARLADIIRAESLKTGHFVLASGKTSDYYLDCRRTTLHPEGAYLVGHVFLDVIEARNWQARAVGGLTLGADPVATAVAIASHVRGGVPLSAFLVRKERKQHGTGQQIEGAPEEGSPVVLVEDVMTTGGSILKAAVAAREARLDVRGAIVLVDREDGGGSVMESEGIPFEPVFTARELLGRD